jgi:hypothetical protein
VRAHGARLMDPGIVALWWRSEEASLSVASKARWAYRTDERSINTNQILLIRKIKSVKSATQQ